MTTFRNVFDQVQLALASYARNLDANRTGLAYVQALTVTPGAGMSVAEAAEFARTYAVLDQFTDPLTGLSATVFEQSGRKYMAVRGTEAGFASVADWLSNVAGIRDEGIAVSQSVSLINYLQRMCAPRGAPVVQYTYNVVLNSIGVTTGTGSGLLTGETDLTVTGHSLGGHLAMVLSRAAPSIISSVYTFNSPGFDTSLHTTPFPLTSDGFFEALLNTGVPLETGDLGATWNGEIMSHFAVEGDQVHLIGTIPGASARQVFSESTNQGVIDAHLIKPIADSLALYALFEEIDPSLEMSASSAIESHPISEILKGASNRPAESLEAVLDALREIYWNPSNTYPERTKVGDREQYYAHLYEEEFRLAVSDRSGVLSVLSLHELSASTLLSRALNPSELSYRYALRKLNSFVIGGDASLYAAHNLKGELNILGSDGATALSLSENFLADRAAFLAWRVLSNSADLEAQSDSDAVANWNYVDNPQAYSVYVSGGGASPSAPARIARFGGDGADGLVGGLVDDRLYGGRGPDLLRGGAGDDYLEGGASKDVYVYTASTSSSGALANDGSDHVFDTDGDGVIRYTYTNEGLLSDVVTTRVIGGLGIRTSGVEWLSPDGKFTFEQDFGGLRASIAGDAGGSLFVLGYDFAAGQDGGYLGIRLTEDITSPALPVRTFLGDKEDWDSDPSTPLVVDRVLDEFGNYIRADGQDGRPDILQPDRADVFLGSNADEVELFDTAGGNDFVQADGTDSVWSAQGGNDVVITGAGSDTVEAGGGNDWVEGGPGDDILGGNAGDDVIWAEASSVEGTAITLAQAITAGNVAAPTAGQGDLLAGDGGSDRLIGASTADLLLGGAGVDIIVGGGGDDNIYGDAALVSADHGWAATRSVTVQGSTIVYELSANGYVLDGTLPGADGNADYIYGGAGADWIFAGAGDDYVEGGDTLGDPSSPDDVIFGEAGDDTLIGGSGADTIHGDSAAVDAAGLSGNDYLDGGAGIDLLFGGGGDDILFGGDGGDQLHGNDGNDILIGERGNDLLVGGAGKDTYVFYRGDGVDTIQDVAADDDAADASVLVAAGPGIFRGNVRFRPGSLIVDFGEGDEVHFEGFDPDDPTAVRVLDVIQFSDGDFMSFDDILAQGFDIDGTSADDEIYGTAVSDRILAGDGNDYVLAKAGDDVVDGGAGDDEIHAGEGSDTVTAGDGADFVDGAEGDDSIDGGLGDDTLRGGAGADVILGGDGQDRIFGEAGDDTLAGDGGDDTLDGGSGNDTLTGGAGSDAYVLYGGMGADSVTDGEGGETNFLQLGAGVSLETLAAARVDDDLVVRLRGLKDSVTIADYYSRPQSWVVRDMAGVETDLETVINLPDPYAGDYVARLWADTRLGGIAQVMGQAYAIGWTPLDGDTFESFYEGAYLSVAKDTTHSTYTRLDPPNDILAQTTTEETSSSVVTFTSFGSSTFHWLLNSFEPGYLESDEGFFQMSLGQLPQTQTSGQALLTLKPDRQLTHLNYQSTAFPGITTQVSYDTGNGTVEALLTSQIVEESYNEFADVTKIDLDTAGWPEPVRSVFGGKVLANTTRVEDHYLSVRELRGGPSDNFIFANSAGLAFDLVTLMDGGAGNDTLVAENGLLYGNAGDDELRGTNAILIGGDGNDTIIGEGGSQFVYLASEVGIDTIAETAIDTYDYLDWYYGSSGIEDWEESAEFGGMYRAEFDDGESGGDYDYYDTYEEAEADGGSDITFINPLPSFAPAIGRGDGDALAALEDAGVVKRDIVRFGPGLTLEDLDLTYTVMGSRADQHPEYPQYVGGTLSVRWGPGAGFDVEVPDAQFGLVGAGLFDMVSSEQYPFDHPAYWDYQLGLGVEAFEFVDGPSYSLEEILQQADLNPVYAYQFERGSGYQQISTEWRSVDFAADIAPSDVYFVGGSFEMEFGITGDSAYGVIYGWYRNHQDIPQIEFRFADGTVYDPDTVTRMGRTYNGSEFNDVLTADVFYSSALIGRGGDDVLNGRRGNDLLNGGPGNDTEVGGEGNDIYVFGADSDVDVVNEFLLNGGSQGIDTIRFAADIAAADLVATRSFYDLALAVNGGTARLELPGWFTEAGGTVEIFEFDDGTTWLAPDVEALLPAQTATDGDDVLLGLASSETMDGLAGDDVLYGFGGNDTLIGGAGDDTLRGEAGDDSYVFHPGDGHDLISDLRGANTVDFGPGVDPMGTVVTRDESDLYLVVDEGRGRVGVRNWFWQPGAKLAQATFADGTTWNTVELEGRVVRAPATIFDDILWGGNDVDVIDALEGDDVVYGNEGDDVVDGGDGADELWGGNGNNILRGGDGDDYLDASQVGHSLLDGGEGDDHIYYEGRSIAVGGAGDDFIEVYGSTGVVAFNPGDGADTIYVNNSFTLSIGGGAGPTDLLLSQDGGDLILSVGAQDSVRLTNDFGGPGSWRTMLLQLFGSAHVYNLGGAVNEFYAAVAADPSITEFALGDVLPDYLFLSSETGALGGIIAHQYATYGSIAHVPDEDLLPVLQDPQFGGFFQSTEYAGSNGAPTVENPLADVTAAEDAAFSFEIPANTFVDPDAGDVLAYAATLADGSTLPSWLSFDPETAAFSGTPLQADVGAADITVTATDSGGLTAEDTFTLTVENVNDAPYVAVPLLDQSFEAESPFSFSVSPATFADEDPGDALSYSGTLFGGLVLPTWLGFDPATAVFSGNPTTSDIGIYHLQVKATDKAGAFARSDFGLVVHAVAGSEVDGTAGDDVLYGGTGDETLSAKGGNDYLYGDIGNDLLKGGAGQDVLQGGDGDDVLRSGKGEDVLDGGAGDDLIFGGTGSSLIVGGIGNDTIRTRSGSDVILFNRGDGMDTVISDGRGDNTLSFGGGIRYSDLTLSRDGKDLIVSAGEGDGLVLRNWYANKQSVLNLQIILDASDDFDATSSDPLYNRRVQTFDFQGMVSAFDNEYAQSPGLTSWAITNALLAFHLSGVDDFAIGGDLAYWYGKRNTFAGISLSAAQEVIGAEGFGSDAQSLRPFTGLQEGYVKLV